LATQSDSSKFTNLSSEEASKELGIISAPATSKGSDGLDPVGLSFDNRGISGRPSGGRGLRYDDGETPQDSASKRFDVEPPVMMPLADSVRS
jgi:hypothetical protein